MASSQLDSNSPREINTRFITKAFGTAYFLPSDEEERQRLTRQHTLLKKLFDNILIHAPLTLTAGDQVLESATGTGIWLLELAREVHKDTILTGIDIERRLFPDPSTLSPNLHFQVQSVLNLPSEWSNNFTFVHQRLLIASLRNNEWPIAINELFRVLKPGGWIQLMEPEWPDGTGGPITHQCRKLWFELAKSRGISAVTLATELPQQLGQSGFIDVRVRRQHLSAGRWAGEDGIAGTDQLLGVLRSIKGPVLSQGGFGVVDNGEMYDQLLEQMEEELDCTEGAGTGWFVICAQKPAKAGVN